MKFWFVRKCSTCKRELCLSQFPVCRNGPYTSLRNDCKACYGKVSAERNRKHRARQHALTQSQR